MPDERLQKVLARAGVASRRAAETLITAGRVRVDGRIVSELGVRVGSRAKVEVDGRLVVAEPLVYIVLHKPRGVVCTLRDPEGRPTIAEYLKDVGSRVVPVGRLDFHTSGALICTNDGELASHLMHPRHHAKKEYVAKVGGVVDERGLALLRERIMIDGRATQPAEVTLLRVEDGKTWLSVKLGEGRNRQVRRLGEHAGVPVMRLVRVAHAGITAEGLRPGEWRRLTTDELRAMKQEYGVPRRIHAADPRVAEARGGHLALRQPRTDTRRAREPVRDARNVREPVRDARNVREPMRDARNVREPMRNVREPTHDARNVREPVRDARNVRNMRQPVRDTREPSRGAREPSRDARNVRVPVRNARNVREPVRNARNVREPVRDARSPREPVREARSPREPARGKRDSRRR